MATGHGLQFSVIYREKPVPMEERAFLYSANLAYFIFEIQINSE
jgi:hypothetical protein